MRLRRWQSDGVNKTHGVWEQSTAKRVVEENVNLLERAGVNLQSSSTRETLTFSAEFGHQHLPTVMELLGNNFCSPLYDPAEVEDQKQVRVPPLLACVVASVLGGSGNHRSWSADPLVAIPLPPRDIPGTDAGDGL